MKTHIEISKENLIHNLKIFKRISGKPLMFVVKANAYGHGLREVIKITRHLSYIQYYAVDSVEEALMVKELDGGKKILILGWTAGEDMEPVVEHDFETVAPSEEFLKQLDQQARKSGKTAYVHLKVETGTARLGMRPEKAAKVLDRSPYKNIEVVGVYSHFANIEDTTDHSYAQHQLEVFNNLLANVKSVTGHLVKHFSCSASTLLFPKTYFDVVRVGISAYGYWPSRETYISYIEQNKERIQLKPVLSWHSQVAQVKTLNTGDHIGYGITYRTFNKTRIIVVPVGYYDGYDRQLSNMATVIVNGVKAPLRGRVCMDMFMAEVTHIKNIKPGDRVTMLGQGGEEIITADDMAEWSGTINYEILARINPLIPRVVV